MFRTPLKDMSDPDTTPDLLSIILSTEGVYSSVAHRLGWTRTGRRRCRVQGRAHAPEMETRADCTASDIVVATLVGHPVALVSPDHEWLGYVRCRFAAFITDEPPVFTVEHQTTGLRPLDLSVPMMTRAEERRVESTPTGFGIHGETFTASVDLEARTAQVEGPCALYPLDSVLRHVLPILLGNGLLLHAAAEV